MSDQRIAMTNLSKLKPMVDIIANALTQEMDPEPGLLHFLTSTFSVNCASDLEDLKSKGREDDLDLFLDLAVAPSADVMERMEPLLWNEMISDKFQRLLADAVSKTVSHLSFGMPESQEPVLFKLSTEKIISYIQKLHLDYLIPPSLLNAMDHNLSMNLKTGVCLSLRRERIRFVNDDTEDFLIRFINEAHCFGDEFLTYLDLAVPVLNGSGSGMTVRDALVSRLGTQKKTLAQIIESQDMMKKNSMEALMLQGFRIPPASRDTTEKEIAMLNRILACVFGSIGQEPEPIFHNHLGNHDSLESVEKIIRLLS